MAKNKLLLAAAGSGKTSFLVNDARKVKDKRVLITTYTEENAKEIKSKFRGKVPANITIQTWFSFLLEHGVRPFQDQMHIDLHDVRIGFLLFSGLSGVKYRRKDGTPVYWGENQNFFKYYFTDDYRIYSDKISKFIIKCNEITNGAVIDRISRIYQYIFVDEVQDLAGWDLEILKLLFESSSNVVLAGDPRQVTYLTNHGNKHTNYRDGKIKNFIEEKCNSRRTRCEIEEETLSVSHRNNAYICEFSSAIFPDYEKALPCDCPDCRRDHIEHQGIFAVHPRNVADYCALYKPQILRYKMAKPPEMNYGESKGSTFDRVLIYPTEDIVDYLRTGNLEYIQAFHTRAKLYVAVTRARYSVAFVLDYESDAQLMTGISRWQNSIRSV